jgi:hypothetical protein
MRIADTCAHGHPLPDHCTRCALATELHDTVANGLVMIAMQASVTDQGFDQAHRLRLVEESARRSLAEIREIITRLTLAGPTTPVPQWALASGELRRLVADVTGGEERVDLHVMGEEYPVDRDTRAILARVAVEALVNAFKHAPGRPVAMTLRFAAVVDLVVVTAPHERDTRPWPAAEPALLGEESLMSSGRGLVGLARLVREHDGRLRYGKLPDGSFRVWARLLPTGGTR